jgi:hypothetical protein
MWRKAITASTTFCQLRSSISDCHLVNHVLSITRPSCWELRYPCSNFSIRVASDQRPCHREREDPLSRSSLGVGTGRVGCDISGKGVCLIDE